VMRLVHADPIVFGVAGIVFSRALESRN
jgi:hypothetical protein